jgi:hypothetical protein
VNDDLTSIDEVLAGLPRSNPDAARSERIRARCHRKLTRPRSLPAMARSATAGRTFESVVVGGFCAAYFFGVALMALHTHGLL